MAVEERDDIGEEEAEADKEGVVDGDDDDDDEEG